MPAGATRNKKFFLSAATREFGSDRAIIAAGLTRDNVEVKTQEELYNMGYTTLEKLDHYIAGCDAVIHLLGDATGAIPETEQVKRLLEIHPDLPDRLKPLKPLLALPDPGISYTQWEAYMAIYHNRKLLIYRPVDEAPRAAGYQLIESERESQLEHYERICAMGRDRGQFHDVKDLIANILRDLVDILAESDSPAARLLTHLGLLCRSLCTHAARRMQAVHRAITPFRRHFAEYGAESWSFWSCLLIRLWLFVIAATVIWEFCFKLEDSSLYGLQQTAFLYLAAIGNFFLLDWQSLHARVRRLVKLARGKQRHGRRLEFTAKLIDLILTPLEITCVVAALSISSERLLRRTAQFEAYPYLALLTAVGVVLLSIQSARHWPVYRHWFRRLRNSNAAGWALAVNWLIGFWFLFSPQLLPTGAVAEYQTTGEVISHLAAGSESNSAVDAGNPQELAVASHTGRGNYESPRITDVEIVRLPDLTKVKDRFEDVPWVGRFLQELAFNDGRLTARSTDYESYPVQDRLDVWQRDRTWKTVRELPPAEDYYIHEQQLDRYGRLLVYAIKKPPAGQEGPTVADLLMQAVENTEHPPLDQESQPDPRPPAPYVFGYSDPPGSPFKWLTGNWANGLASVSEFALSADGQSLAIVGIPQQSPTGNQGEPAVLRLFSFGPFVLGLVDLKADKLVWTQSLDDFAYDTLAYRLTFSPDSRRLLLSRHSSLDGGQHFLVDVTDPKNFRTIKTDAETAVWSPDSRYLAIRGQHKIEIFSSQNVQLIETFRVPRGEYTTHVITRDSNFLAAAGNEGTLWLYPMNK